MFPISLRPTVRLTLIFNRVEPKNLGTVLSLFKNLHIFLRTDISDHRSVVSLFDFILYQASIKFIFGKFGALTYRHS